MKITILYLSVIAVLFSGCSQDYNQYHSTNDLSELSVSNNMRSIMLGLFSVVGEDGYFQNKLSDFTNCPGTNGQIKVNAWQYLPLSTFICPETGTHPGSISNVDEWTDYIYIGHIKDSWPNVPLIISPPENHHNMFGYVAFPNLGVIKLPPHEIRELVNKPWLLVTNVTPENLDSIKRNIIVNIPKKLQYYYTNANDWVRP